MELLLPVLTIAAAITLAAMSPGPSFLMVARTALAVSRRSGLAVALGMGLGSALFALLGILGLDALLTHVPILYLALKLMGGIYLVYLGYSIFSNARVSVALESSTVSQGYSSAFWVSLARGFFTQISNPKTVIIYASIFVSLLPREISWSLGTLLCLMIFSIEAGWYVLVALALSSVHLRKVYFGGKTVIDRCAGGVMFLLGMKLLMDIR